jgi:hypothetical protein
MTSAGVSGCVGTVGGRSSSYPANHVLTGYESITCASPWVRRDGACEGLVEDFAYSLGALTSAAGDNGDREGLKKAAAQ